jgi:hypothetical protein
MVTWLVTSFLWELPFETCYCRKGREKDISDGKAREKM